MSEKTQRPSLDVYFMTLTKLVAWRSTCTRRKVGAVLVRDRMIISTGYNETPRGTPNCGDRGCPRCADTSVLSGSRLDECLCVHAEQNALIQAAFHGQQTAGATLYTLALPCLTCAKLIVNAGVTRVVYCHNYSSLGSFTLLSNTQVELVHITADQLPPLDL